jgi:hypothetical protein
LVERQKRAEQIVICTDAGCSPKLVLLRGFLVNELIGVHMELEQFSPQSQRQRFVITTLTTNGMKLVKINGGVRNPQICLVLGNLEPSLAAWLELQQALFCEFFSMKPLLCPLMTIDVEQLFPCRVLVSKFAHPSPNCGCQRLLLRVKV